MSDDFFRTIGNLRTLRATLKTVSIEQLKEFAHKLTVIIEEREAEDEAQKKDREERERKVAQIREQLTELGIDPEELLAPDSQKSISDAKQRKKTPKYEYTDTNGVYHTWTGQGRTPRPIQSAIDNGGKCLEDFLIENKGS